MAARVDYETRYANEYAGLVQAKTVLAGAEYGSWSLFAACMQDAACRVVIEHLAYDDTIPAFVAGVAKFFLESRRYVSFVRFFNMVVVPLHENQMRELLHFALGGSQHERACAVILNEKYQVFDGFHNEVPEREFAAALDYHLRYVNDNSILAGLFIGTKDWYAWNIVLATTIELLMAMRADPEAFARERRPRKFASVGTLENRYKILHGITLGKERFPVGRYPRSKYLIDERYQT